MARLRCGLCRGTTVLNLLKRVNWWRSFLKHWSSSGVKPVVDLVKSCAFRKNENVLSSDRQNLQRVPKGGLWRFWHLLSVAVPIFLKSPGTTIFGNSVATLCPAACAATDTASAQTHFVFPTQQGQPAIKKLNSSRRRCNQQRAEDL